MIKSKTIFASFALVGALFLPLGAAAAESGTSVEPKFLNWSFGGLFGTYDTNQLRRGFQVFQEVCSSCHSAKLLAFRNLSEPGGPAYSEAQIKALAATFTIADPSADGGERAGVPSDYWPSPFDTEQDARDANGGALPPDFSVIAKAREIKRPFPYWLFNYFTAYQEGGPDYIYNLMVNYHDTPADVTIPDGKFYNAFFANNAISMPPPLQDELVTYEGTGVPLTVDQYAKDVSAFLMWVSEPHLVERKELGFKVLIFLVLLAGLMYMVKRKLWANIPH